MTIAEDQIKGVESWFNIHDRTEYSRDGKVAILRGDYAAIVPVGVADTALPDFADAIRRNHLPFVTPQGAKLKSKIVHAAGNGTANRDLEARLVTILRDVTSQYPGVVVVGLSTSGTSIQAALADAGLAALDLDARGVLAVPLYSYEAVSPNMAQRIEALLPVS